MPLDEAIYVSSVDKIFGCRGKWVYKFNATTGRKEAEARIANDIIGITSLCEHNGTIYVCGWESLRAYNQNLGEYPDNRDFYTLNPTTMAVANTGIFKSYRASSYTGEYIFGPSQVISDGTNLWGIIGAGTNSSSFFRVDPNIPASLILRNTGGFSAGKGECGMRGGRIIYSSQNSMIAFVQPWSGGYDVSTYDLSAVSVGQFYTTPFTAFTGICYSPANDSYYMVKNTLEVVRLTGSALAAPASFFILDAAAVPWRLRYRASNGLIYIPTWSNDTVEILDPATDTITAIKTGFSDPIDVVFTPTKAFAVQNSSVPLKEIT